MALKKRGRGRPSKVEVKKVRRYQRKQEAAVPEVKFNYHSAADAYRDGRAINLEQESISPGDIIELIRCVRVIVRIIKRLVG